MKKILFNTPSVLLGTIYIVFGSNFFLHFIPLPSMGGYADTFVGLMVSTGFLTVVKVIEVITGILLVSGVQRPLGALLIAPISISILMFELFMVNQIGIGLILVIINAFVIFQYKEKFIPIIH
jgi:putative oxidoreductase